MLVVASAPIITETRGRPLFRTTRERGHEVERGRKALANRPKTRNFGLPRKYHGVEKTVLGKNEKVLPGAYDQERRGRTPPNRQSFRGCPNVLLLCLSRGHRGVLTRLACICRFRSISAERDKPRFRALVGDHELIGTVLRWNRLDSQIPRPDCARAYKGAKTTCV